VTAAEAIASVVEHALATVPSSAVFVPTRTGTTARMISRFRPAAWIVALCADRSVCRELAFAYGVHAVELAQLPEDWREFAREWLARNGVPGPIAMLVTGPSERHPTPTTARVPARREASPPR